MFENRESGFDGEKAYSEFLSDVGRFEKGLRRVLSEWPVSCEHFLSNPSMNRIAWLGQAAMCIEAGVPAVYRGGFKFLSSSCQEDANALALRYLKLWELRQK